ncbi:hypothetical protein ACQKO5_19270 [Novosphingobium subterraneum]|uniref:hypothetical protein n=1 Tax=Novosphingobium subterraneum TaxID=48936 RepID=UPI003D07927F
MSFRIKGLIYGPDDTITAAIASWQLIKGNGLFNHITPYLKRYRLSLPTYTSGKEDNLGVIDLNIHDIFDSQVPWNGSLWKDFLVHCDQLFLLQYEHLEFNPETGRGKIISHRSEKNLNMLRLRYELDSEAQPIPDTERPFLAL